MPFEYKEVDIAKPEHKRWSDLYGCDIPVIHLNEKEVARHRVEERQLLQLLSEAPRF